MEPTLTDIDFDFDLELDNALPAAQPVRVYDNNLKNTERISAIRATMIAHKTLVLHTPIACRQLRRDFNIASAKMYVYGLNRAYKAEIIGALEGLEFAVDLLEMDVAPWKHLPSPLTPRSFDLLLVSAQSVRMMKALQSVDRCMIGVYAGLIGEAMTKDQRDTLIRPFQMAYMDFKRVAMKLEMNGTAQELVDSMN